MAAPCTCPNGQHDGRFPYCSGTSGGPIVIDRLPAPGPATVSCEAIPMVVCPHGNSAASHCVLCLRERIAALVRENARLEALIVEADYPWDGILDEADRIRSRR